MLKMQRPNNIAEYTAIDPMRTNELHLLGFIPEYLYNNMMYFKATPELMLYLQKGIKPAVKKETKLEVKLMVETPVVPVAEVKQHKEYPKKNNSHKKYHK